MSSGLPARPSGVWSIKILMSSGLLARTAALSGVSIGHVERKGVRLAPGIENLLGGLGRSVGVHIEQDDLRTFACVADRDRAADTGAGTRDCGDVVLQ